MADTAAAPSVDGSGAAAPTGMFRSLANFNARLYFSGLLLSTIGSWLQLTATSYLVYRLTGKASDLGYNVAFQFLPMLLLGTWPARSPTASTGAPSCCARRCCSRCRRSRSACST